MGSGDIILSGNHRDVFRWQGNALESGYLHTSTLNSFPLLISMDEQGNIQWMNSYYAVAFEPVNIGISNGTIVAAGTFTSHFIYEGDTISSLEEGNKEGFIAYINQYSAKGIRKTKGTHGISHINMNYMVINDAGRLYLGGMFNTHEFDGIVQPHPGINTGFVWRPKDFLVDLDPVTEHTAQRPILYPNPAQYSLHIRIPDLTSDAGVTLYSLTGQMLMQQNIRNNQNIDISTLLPGIYIANINNGQQVWTEKVIIRE